MVRSPAALVAVAAGPWPPADRTTEPGTDSAAHPVAVRCRVVLIATHLPSLA